jgi:signal transduction histidine kinase
MNFADILASSIHDIKNSLGIIANNLEDLLNDPDNQISDLRKANLLRHETQRANNNMIQLLSLYKLDSEQMPVNIQENNLDDLLSEVIAENLATSNGLGIQLEYQCDPYLNGYYDEDLIRGVLNSTIGNAQRYARELIQLSAEADDGYLLIRIEDDGNGYPPAMLKELSEQQNAGSFSSGRTQLGLYFAERVAQMHTTGDRVGSIQLSNHCNLPGSCFELRLP